LRKGTCVVLICMDRCNFNLFLKYLDHSCNVSEQKSCTYAHLSKMHPAQEVIFRCAYKFEELHSIRVASWAYVVLSHHVDRYGTSIRHTLWVHLSNLLLLLHQFMEFNEICRDIFFNHTMWRCTSYFLTQVTL
jgi:hypothetical protein